MRRAEIVLMRFSRTPGWPPVERTMKSIRPFAATRSIPSRKSPVQQGERERRTTAIIPLLLLESPLAIASGS